MNLGEYFKISIISFFVFVLIVYFWEFKLYLKDLNYLNKINYEIDYRKPIEILKDSKNINKNTVIVSNHFKEYIEKPDLSIFPLSGISKRPTIHCNENGYYSKYISDRYGFNNKDEVWDKNKVDYLFIGDSFVHGACVNPEDNISSKFKSLLKNKNLNVINLGYSGSGPLIQLASLKEYTKIHTPQNIIWFYYEGNDLSNLDDELKNEILKKYIEDNKYDQNLIFNQNKSDLELEKYINLKYFNYLNKNIPKNKTKEKELKSKLIKLNRLREKFSSNYRYSNPINNNFENIFEFIHTFKQENNINLYFVYLPQRERYFNFFFEDKKQHILNILKKNKIKIIDVDNELFKKNDALNFFSFRNEGHYNEIGYESIAILIKQHINS